MSTCAPGPTVIIGLLWHYIYVHSQSGHYIYAYSQSRRCIYVYHLRRRTHRHYQSTLAECVHVVPTLAVYVYSRDLLWLYTYMRATTSREGSSIAARLMSTCAPGIIIIISLLWRYVWWYTYMQSLYVWLYTFTYIRATYPGCIRICARSPRG